MKSEMMKRRYDMNDNKMYIAQLHKVIERCDFLEELENKSILITGATGMVGTCMIDLLQEYDTLKHANIGIVAMARNGRHMQEAFDRYADKANLVCVVGDVNQSMPQTGKADYIIHAASNTHPLAYASDPIGTIQTNVLGLKNLLDFAAEKKVKRMVFLSSVEIYGENRGDAERFAEDYCGYLDCNTLRAGYPEGKRVGEALCQAYRKHYGLDIVIPRLSRLYGPTMRMSDTKAISQFIKKAAAGEDIVLKSGGNQLYSYTYVVDAVSAILHILCKGKDGEAYNVSDMDSEITLKDLAGILADEAHTRVIFDLPDEQERQGYSSATKALLDAGKLEKLGWSADTGFNEGLTTTLSSISLKYSRSILNL